MMSHLFRRHLVVLLALTAASIPILFRRGLPNMAVQGGIRLMGGGAAARRNTTLSMEKPQSTSPKQKQQRILMASFVFGEEAARKKYLHMFAESARTSGIDVALVGDPVPPFALPPNVRHVPITWNDLVDLIHERLFLNATKQDLEDLKRAKYYYKVTDFKPLFAFLFPEQVASYDWWGHVDNDLILGNVRRFLTHDILTRHDIISGIDQKTWGPFTLYRNSNVTNELFRLADCPLEEIFASPRHRAFDEWGGGRAAVPLKSHTEKATTMSAIVEKHADRLGLRWYGNIPMIWDGLCGGKMQPSQQERCSECLFERKNETTTKLVSGYDNDYYAGKDVLLCHYQMGKSYLEKSLEDGDSDKVVTRLVNDGAFRVSYTEGFRPLHREGLQQV